MSGCVICRNSNANFHSRIGELIHIACDRCGEFRVTRAVIQKIASLSAKDRNILSAFVREKFSTGLPPIVGPDDVDLACSFPRPDLFERADRLLTALFRANDLLGSVIDVTKLMPGLLAVTWSLTPQEFAFVRNFLIAQKYADVVGDDVSRLRITSQGHQRLLEIRHRAIDSVQAFVAMWFGGEAKREEMDHVWSAGLAKGIILAGYRPHRVDKGEYNGRIDDEIMRQIRQSRFLVSDFTAQNQGVYYETGFAEGLRIPIIQTCFSSDVRALHFDNRQINTIVWNSVDELALQLRARIEGTLGRGPLRSDQI